MDKYFVDIIETESGELVRRLGPFSLLSTAEQCERGAMINMDHDRFHTVVFKQ